MLGPLCLVVDAGGVGKRKPSGVESPSSFNTHIEEGLAPCQLPSPRSLKLICVDHQHGVEGARFDPYSDPMTDALADSIETAAAAVAAIADPIERYRAARDERTKLASGDRTFMEIQQAVAWELYESRTWAEVGEALGVSGSRAEAIAKGR